MPAQSPENGTGTCWKAEGGEAAQPCEMVEGLPDLQQAIKLRNSDATDSKR